MAMVHPKEGWFTTCLVFPPHLLRIGPSTNPYLATFRNVIGSIDGIRDLIEFGRAPEVKVSNRPTVFVHVVANPMWERILSPSAADMGACSSGAVRVAAGRPVDVEMWRLCPLRNRLGHGLVCRTIGLCDLA